jgi:hypothetical protein
MWFHHNIKDVNFLKEDKIISSAFSAPFLSSNFITVSCPHLAAHDSGV